MSKDVWQRNFGDYDVASDLNHGLNINASPEDMSVVRLDMFVNHEDPKDESKDIHLSTGTGVILTNSDASKSLVTAWHNFSGLHHQTRQWLSKATKCSPTHVRIRNHYQSKQGKGFNSQRISLYKQSGEPVWVVHPRKRNFYDIAAIRLKANASSSFRYPALEYFQEDMFPHLKARFDALVAGYPTNDFANQLLPIWKTASIASTPQIPIEGQPKFLIDSATRSGMSGAPVFLHDRSQAMKYGDDKTHFIQWSGKLRLIGIYTGRIHTADKSGTSDLGFVWWDNVVKEVSSSKRLDCAPEYGIEMPKLSPIEIK